MAYRQIKQRLGHLFGATPLPCPAATKEMACRVASDSGWIISLTPSRLHQWGPITTKEIACKWHQTAACIISLVLPQSGGRRGRKADARRVLRPLVPQKHLSNTCQTQPPTCQKIVALARCPLAAEQPPPFGSGAATAHSGTATDQPPPPSSLKTGAGSSPTAAPSAAPSAAPPNTGAGTASRWRPSSRKWCGFEDPPLRSVSSLPPPRVSIPPSSLNREAFLCSPCRRRCWPRTATPA